MCGKSGLICSGFLFLALILGGCSISADFSDIQGVNLITSRDLDDIDTVTLLPLWQREIADNTYMIFDDITVGYSGPTAGLPDAAAPIFRMEIPNLVTNGDFEGGLAGWTANGSASMSTAAGIIDGNCLQFQHSSSNLDYLELNLAGLPAVDALYSIRFDLKMSIAMENMLFEYDNGTATTVVWTPDLSEFTTAEIISFPVGDVGSIPAFTSAAGGVFHIGLPSQSNSGQQGYLDNLRITRIDQSNTVYLEVPYSDAVRPDLLSGGIYTFSIYVKQEEPADVTPATERYPAESLTLGINPPPSAAYPANPSYSGRTVDISGVTDSTWVKVSVSESWSQKVQVDAPADGTDPVLILTMTPTDSNGNGTNIAGSLLVSTPSLTWTPE